MATVISVPSPTCKAQGATASQIRPASVTWQPPKVEDCPDGEGQETPSVASTPLPATPTTSETSFESDTDDQEEKGNHGMTENAFATLGERCSSTKAPWLTGKSDTSAPLSRRSTASQQATLEISQDNTVRVTTANPLTDHRVPQQDDTVVLKSLEEDLAPPRQSQTSVSRITPATLMTTFFPHTISSSTINQARYSTGATMSSPGGPKVRFSNREPPVIHSQGRPGVPPNKIPDTPPLSPTRQAFSPSVDPSIDLAWGTLFENPGYSTPRLRLVLEGLASYIIARFGQPGDVVITPATMHKVYVRYRLLDDEDHAYQNIFQRANDMPIEQLYLDLRCPYHLVQRTPKSKPTIAGLTLEGWAYWFATSILAYPDREHRRLNKMLADFPPIKLVENPVGEQIMPRHVSRHLLPASYHKRTRYLLNAALQDAVEDTEFYTVAHSPPKHEPCVPPSVGRLSRYTCFPEPPRVTRYSVSRSKSDSRASSPRPNLPFDSRVRARSPAPTTRYATSSPGTPRAMPRSPKTYEPPPALHPRRRSGKSDNPTYEDYFNHTTSRRRDSDSSPERPVTSRRGSSERRRREKG